MRNKNCPWCRRKLNVIELLLLDEHAPRSCRNCGQYLKNSFVNSIVSAVIPVILCATSFYIFDINLLFSLSLLLLVPIFRIALAEPLKFNPNSNNRTCFQCRRTNGRFGNPKSNICDDCLLGEKKHSDFPPHSNITRRN
jgi:hypothetical protein